MAVRLEERDIALIRACEIWVLGLKISKELQASGWSAPSLSGRLARGRRRAPLRLAPAARARPMRPKRVSDRMILSIRARVASRWAVRLRPCQPVVIGVSADPNPNHRPAREPAKGAIAISDANAEPVPASLQTPETKRGMMRVPLP